MGTGAGLQLGYSVVFFAAAFLVALQPEKLTRWLGRLLCPCLLVLILVLFSGCLLHPWQGSTASPPRSIPLAPYYRAYCMATRPWTP